MRDKKRLIKQVVTELSKGSYGMFTCYLFWYLYDNTITLGGVVSIDQDRIRACLGVM